MPAAKSIKVRRKKLVHDDTRLLTKKKKISKQQRLERERQALELRAGGASYDQIATALGLYDKSHSKRIVEMALSRFEIEAAKSVVRMDLQRLDEYIMRCTHALRNNGDLSQIDRLMRIMEFRYRLLGINGEDVRAMQAEHGITNINIKGGVQVVQARTETETEFIQKMMSAVGVDPNSKTATKYLAERETAVVRALPLLAGSANDGKPTDSTLLLDEDAAEILDAEVVEDE